MSQLPNRSVRLRSFATTDLDRLTGERGEVFYDRELRTLKIYNGAGTVASTVTVGPADRLVNGSRSLLLAANGALTISGDIRSDSDINIEINLADSTLQRWRFGEDGSLTFPDGTTQTTAYTDGTVFTNLIDSSDSSAITVIPSTIFSSDVTVENELKIKTLVNDQSKWSFGADGTTEFPNSTLLTANSLSITTNHSATDQTWLFNTTGSLTLPGGATLKDSNYALALGLNAGNTSQGFTAVAIGISAGAGSQGGGAVAIGYIAGLSQQGANAIAIGNQAGNISQGNNAIAIGTYPADSAQGANAIAIGFTAGYTSQGVNAIAIGNSAGVNSQANNSIIINASGSPLNQSIRDTFTVAPIRNVTGASGLLQYNLTTKEVSYNSDIVSEGNINIEINLADSTKRIWQFGEDGALTFPDGTNQSTAGVALPVCVINSSTTGSNIGEVSVNFTVTNPSGVAITAIGIYVPSVNTSNAAQDVGNTNTGTQAKTLTALTGNTRYWAQVYAVTASGTAYSSPNYLSVTSICLLAGTMISMADGTYKAIEDITYADRMLSWDFDRGCYAETTALWIKQAETGSQYNLLTFSDGTTLRTFDQHRIFNKQAGAFTYPMTEATPIGTVTVNEHGEEITLIGKQVVVDTIEYYNVITDHHMNLFSDSVLTSCRFNNIYPILDMKFVKDARTLRTRDEFENIPDRFFYGLRLAEQTYDLAMIEWYVTRLLSVEQSSELALV